MESVVECEICGATENLVYDHDHNTGHHRGVICTGCNKAIGLLGDDVDGVKAALDYLEYYYDNKTNVA
jgi:Fe2+ or Zn2+ uptake regulation protein